MLLIHCPHCGEARPEIEFAYGGEAHVARPLKPAEMDDAAWGRFLFFRANPKGMHAERWRHAHGCQRFFNVLRDTRTDEIAASYLPGAPRPDFEAAAAAPSRPEA